MSPLKRLVISLLSIAIALNVTLPASGAAEKIRKPVASDRFYPANPHLLRTQIKDLLAKASSGNISNVKAIVVPHAGYPYSGPIAAEAYNAIRGQTFESVIIVGFMHNPTFRGVYVDDAEFYETPLGIIPLDQPLAATIRNFHPLLQDRPNTVVSEHSIEVQIPFLQEVLENLKIVPIYIGLQTTENSKKLAEAIAHILENRKILIVVTSDLSHYHTYNEAKEKDQKLVSLYGKADITQFLIAHENQSIEACGAGPLLTLLYLQKEMGWQNPTLLRYTNSGDVTGTKDSVVGYSAFAITGSDAEEILSPKEKEKLFKYVRDFLKFYYRGNTKKPELKLEAPVLDQKRGVFVTLKKKGALRGCVGRIINDETLRKSLDQVALDAAIHDSRFKPVTENEWDELEVHISILTEPSPIASYKDIRLGTDGIVVSHGNKRGVFLPEVATETGWDQETFFKRCALDKAHLSPSELEDAKIDVFQSYAFGESRT